MGNCFGTRGGHDFSPEAAAAQRPSPRGGLRFSVSSGGGGGGGGGAYAPPKAPAGTCADNAGNINRPLPPKTKFRSIEH